MNKIFTFATCLIMAAQLNAQTTIYVKPGGTGDGTSWANACNLETAVVSASLNDRTEIWVQKGTYYPSKMLVVPDSVKIYGGFAGTETNLSQRNFSVNLTIVDGQQKIGSIFRLENSAEINGFTIQNGNANGNPYKSGGGVWADENSVIENCKIINNTAMLNGGGVYANGKVEIINSTIKDNVANGSGTNLFGNCVVLGSEQSGVSSGVDIAGCNDGIPDLGEISFKTQTTWPITFGDVTLTWSDVVKAEGCNKTWYNGGNSGNYSSDCRATDRTKYGDLFSWCTVARFAHVLCPAPWRVPTIEDFSHLDKAMGGKGDGTGTGYVSDSYGGRYHNAAICGKYISNWGTSFGGDCSGVNTLYQQSQYAYFWTLSEYSTELVFCTVYGVVSDGFVGPKRYYDKSCGFTLRCVK